MQGGLLVTSSVLLANTNRTTVYTTPSNHRSIVRQIMVGNVDASNAATVKLELYDASSTSHFALTGATSVAADGYLWLNDIIIGLQAGDLISATGGSANDLTVTVVAEQIVIGG
jgi:hypothetical protein|tara:strand:- start:3140 stop:3481 length:342 start_codon:yes stop_codon:yes gene_type:complete